jgi:hypothetical protein
MAKPRSTPARPRDQNELAKRIVDLATGDAQDEPVPAPDAAAVERGKARAAKLTPEQRADIAKKASAARWGKRQK